MIGARDTRKLSANICNGRWSPSRMLFAFTNSTMLLLPGQVMVMMPPGLMTPPRSRQPRRQQYLHSRRFRRTPPRPPPAAAQFRKKRRCAQKQDCRSCSRGIDDLLKEDPFSGRRFPSESWGLRSNSALASLPSPTYLPRDRRGTAAIISSDEVLSHQLSQRNGMR